MSLPLFWIVLFVLLLLVVVPSFHAYTILPTYVMTTTRTRRTIQRAHRYGPSDSTFPQVDNDDEFDNFDRIAKQNEVAFRQLLQTVLETTSEDQIPSILGQQIPLLVSVMMQQRDVIESILSDSLQSGGPDEQERVADALEYMFGFAETFVEHLKALDDQNKQLLGKIIRSASASSSLESYDENNILPSLDDLLESERNNLTPGFLRHLEGECERIANAPNTTPESLRLLQMLRTIQARVVEELGKELGDEAMVLGQLLGYDDPRERIAVLKAGMGVRGVEFSRTMEALTEKALADFQRLGPDAVDPELVERVKGIHDTIQEFLSSQNA